MVTKAKKKESPKDAIGVSFGYSCCGECSYYHKDWDDMWRCFVVEPEFSHVDDDGNAVALRAKCDVESKDPACKAFKPGRLH